MEAQHLPPEPIEPDVGEKGPDWTLILTRALALLVLGLCAGVLLSRPWAHRDDPPPPTPTVSVTGPSPSPEPS